MADTYSVLYTGRLQPGVDLEQVVAAFAARFGVHPQRVRGMLAAGDEVILESGLTADQARDYRRALERIGLVVRTDPLSQEAAEPAAPAGAGTGPDPFQPPRVDLEAVRGSGDLHEPVRVPVSHGWRWLKEGFSMVFASPGAWIGTVVVWAVLGMVLNLIPVVNFLAALITAVFVGGIMIGAREQDTGGSFTVGHLFAGFSDKFGPLFLLGVLYLVGTMAAVLLTVVIMGGLLSATVDLSAPEAELSAELATSPVLWLPVLIGVALGIPLVMAYWFAPVLVAIDGVSPLRAMALSFRACFRNILPFLLYGLIAMVLLILGGIPLLLGLLIVVPGILASLYASYRDIFRS